MGERLLARRGEEAVDVALLNRVVRRVELTLDRVDFAVAGLGDEVDADVATVDPALLRPNGVRKHCSIELTIFQLVLEILDRQLLEVRSLFALRDGGRTKTLE